MCTNFDQTSTSTKKALGGTPLVSTLDELTVLPFEVNNFYALRTTGNFRTFEEVEVFHSAWSKFS